MDGALVQALNLPVVQWLAGIALGVTLLRLIMVLSGVDEWLASLRRDWEPESRIEVRGPGWREAWDIDADWTPPAGWRLDDTGDPGVFRVVRDDAKTRPLGKL